MRPEFEQNLVHGVVALGVERDPLLDRLEGFLVLGRIDRLLHVVAELVRAVSAGELTEDEAARRSPYPEDVTLSALSHTQPAWSYQPTMP